MESEMHMVGRSDLRDGNYDGTRRLHTAYVFDRVPEGRRLGQCNVKSRWAGRLRNLCSLSCSADCRGRVGVSGTAYVKAFEQCRALKKATRGPARPAARPTGGAAPCLRRAASRETAGLGDRAAAPGRGTLDRVRPFVTIKLCSLFEVTT